VLVARTLRGYETQYLKRTSRRSTASPPVVLLRGYETQYLKRTPSPTEHAIHPVDEFIVGHAAATHEELLHVGARNDGTTVLRYRMEGDREAFARRPPTVTRSTTTRSSTSRWGVPRLRSDLLL
jgi:hypothetical protein